MRVLVNIKGNEKQPIHSGHFMVSNFEDEAQEEDEVLVPDDPDEARRTESVITFVPQTKRARVDYGMEIIQQNTLQRQEVTLLEAEIPLVAPAPRPGIFHSTSSSALNEFVEVNPKPILKKRYNSSGDGNPSTLEIDQSLTKLFQCMSIAYRQKLTSPKWNLFKGMKLRWKDKIRLNNVIWRCWHMQFIFKHRGTIIQFASPLDVDQHCKPEAIVLEGKYWKRRLATVTAEYKKWRIFFKNKIMGRNLSGSDQNLSLELDLATGGLQSPRNVGGGGIDLFDDAFLMEFSDTLFTSLASNQPYPFPNAREIAKNASIADFIQPGLIQLQPYLDEFTEMETLQSYELMNGRLHHMSADDVSSLNDFTRLAAPTPQVQPVIASRSSTLGDAFSADFSIAENRAVDPLKTMIHSPASYGNIRPNQESYPMVAMEGRSRSNSFGKRTYDEFTGSSEGLVTVNQQHVASLGQDSGVVQHHDQNREFAIPLTRPRSRSRSGSFSRPPSHHSVSPVPPKQRPDIEPMQTDPQMIIPDLIPFSGRMQQHYQQREVVSQPDQMNLHIRPQGGNRVRIEPRLTQDLEHGIRHLPPPQTRVISRPVISVSGMSGILVQEQQYRPPEVLDARKESAIFSLLTMGTGLQGPPTPHLPGPAPQRPVFTQCNRPAPTSSVPLQGASSVMVAQNGMVSVYGDFNSIAMPQPQMVHYVPAQEIPVVPMTPMRKGRPPDEVKTKDPESKKSSHISSEQKRRGSMKNGFDILHSLIPGLGNQPPNSKNSDTSKAAMLHRGAEYIKQLRMDRERQLREIELLKKDQADLSSAISHCQSVLPATGAPVSRTNSVIRVKGTFDAWVRSRTMQNWKFWIFSRLIEPLLDTFFNAIDASSPSEFWSSVYSWVEQYCSLVNLRPAALNTLREISTKTEILDDPGSMPAYAYYAVKPKDEP